MATATSERRPRPRARPLLAALLVPVAAAIVAVLALAGGRATGVRSAGGGAAARGAPSAFSWLRPGPPPRGWRIGRLRSGAALAYPAGWHAIASDAGTFSAALGGTGGRIVSYLNATPRDGAETLANWSRFRPHHVAEEGAHDVRLLAAAGGLRFASGRGSCVIDDYSTSVASYREIACLVSGEHTSTVVVGAAQPRDWTSQGPLLERAIASFAT